jgi:Sortase domain
VSRLGSTALAGFAGYGVIMAVAGIALLSSAVTTDVSDDPFVVSSAPVDDSSSPRPSADRSLVAVVPQPAARASGRATARAGVGAVPNARRASQAPGQVVAYAPVRLVLPAGQQAPVVGVGVRSDGALVIPTDPKVVGYWTGGALAGERFGSLVVAGHVDSATFGLGVLSALKRVHVGQVVQLAGPAGQLTRYRVSQIKVVTQQSLATNDEYFRQDGPARLVVITCGGPFDPVRHRYQDNVVVVATPLP